ncbi:shikimate dehydrogenase [Flexivirga caeni]|uniref:Shikimate dehydrogenase n=1 Tax=Flexivirga caeni TaxID=2294115 RepID=A0A3M9LXL6_9MICO|nr:shikimate dehydrogenase [Flexivirga caeni]RNI18049.1 shikimate dehydrogenase [Flexivirga caeni]
MLTRARAAVLGKPVAHSLSPVLHRAAYAALGLTDWSYDRRECDAAGLRDLVAGLGPTWRGLSLTMPLKEEALLIADSSSEVARQTGAVNTLVREGREWRGYNTDVAGIREALREAGVGSGGRSGRAVVIGSGATARSALAALAELGVREVVFVVRKDTRASTLAQARDHGFGVSVVRGADGADAVLGAPLVVSAVPAGATDSLAQELAGRSVPGSEAGPAPAAGWGAEGCVLLDVVYAGWPTPLAEAAASYGVKVVPGIEMLIHQAAAQVELMTGQRAPLEVMRRAGRAAAGLSDGE